MATPIRTELTTLSASLPTIIDIFICSASFEGRCLSIPLALPKSRIGKALVCANEDFRDHLSGNLQILRDHFGENGNYVALRQDNPVFGVDALFLALQGPQGSQTQNVVVDATTFTHEGLLILLRLLASVVAPTNKVTVVYTPASEYARGLPNEQKWLSRGLREVRSVLGFPGLMVPTRKLHLIVLVGFEAERARLLIDACEPDIISLGRADDATDISQAHLPINVDTLRQLAVHYAGFDEFSFSSVDLERTCAVLTAQRHKYSNYNTVVATMNTKLSTIGAALFALSHTDVQLCYAPAHTYNVPDYSAPSEHCLITQLHLPQLHEHASPSMHNVKPTG